MKTIAIAMLIIFATVSVAEAKCFKNNGKRTLDGVTKSECAVLRGEWRDASAWPRPDLRRAREKK